MLFCLISNLFSLLDNVRHVCSGGWLRAGRIRLSEIPYTCHVANRNYAETFSCTNQSVVSLFIIQWYFFVWVDSTYDICLASYDEIFFCLPFVDKSIVNEIWYTTKIVDYSRLFVYIFKVLWTCCLLCLKKINKRRWTGTGDFNISYISLDFCSAVLAVINYKVVEIY